MENLVLFGGTFDPIHNGHLRIARAASLRLNADVIFVPAKNPAFKQPSASISDRLNMLQLALRENGSSSFSVSEFETKSESPVNYWIDTLRYFKKRYPNQNLYFLIGADEVNLFPKWKNAKEIVKLATPLYVSRPNVVLKDDVLKEYHMLRLDYEGSGQVSSSAIRTLHSMDLPTSVREYIESKQLYYFEKIAPLISKHRLVHSISVARLCYEIAVRNRFHSPEAAYIAGLLHDLGKGTGSLRCHEIMEQHYSQFLPMPEWTLHQFVGAQLAKDIFDIQDPAILDAICFHATGKAHMSSLGKIVYSADKTDPLRGYDSSKLRAAINRSIHYGFLTILRANKAYLEGKGYIVDNSLTAECMKQYLGDE